MRGLRIAGLLGLVVPLAVATSQEPLKAELHYTAATDVWFSTNKPAYVAVYAVSPTGVYQLYPSFSVEAGELTQGVRRVDTQLTGLPPAVWSPYNTALTGVSAVPARGMGMQQTLVLVASTTPLRVGNARTTSYEMNLRLSQQRPSVNMASDADVAALVALVRPADPNAEVTIERVGAVPSAGLWRTTLAMTDPNRVALAYVCSGDPTAKSTLSAVPVGGDFCVAVRTIPRSLLFPDSAAYSGNNAPAMQGAPPAPVPAIDRKAAGPKVAGEVTVISDPEEIRRFIQAQAGTSSGPRDGGHQSAWTPAERSPDVNRRTNASTDPWRVQREKSAEAAARTEQTGASVSTAKIAPVTPPAPAPKSAVTPPTATKSEIISPPKPDSKNPQ